MTPGKQLASLSVLVLLQCAAACGPTSVWLNAVCPSPDGELNAVFWWKEGGGAAGWEESLLTVLPSGVEVDAVFSGDKNYRYVFRATHVQDIQLTWRDTRTLLVAYPDTSALLYASPGGIHTPDTPDLKVIHRGAPARGREHLIGGMKCETGGREVALAPRRQMY